MKDSIKRANSSLISLEESVRKNARSQHDIVSKIYNTFLETRYALENIPDVVLRPEKAVNLKNTGEIRVAQLLSSILCDRIAEVSSDLTTALEFGDEVDIKIELREIYENVNKLKEVAEVQQKLADGAPVSTENIKNLQKKYEKRIKQLEEELLRKEGRALTVSALDMTKKPKLFGKNRFYEQLADLILEYGKKIKASSGGYISLANLYIALKKQVPDIDFSTKDVEKVCKSLKKNKLIQDVSDKSGVKIVEFVPVSLSKDATKVFRMAAEKGYVTLEETMLNTKWDQQRAKRVLQNLVKQGIAIKSSPQNALDSGERYYFPGLSGDDDW